MNKHNNSKASQSLSQAQSPSSIALSNLLAAEFNCETIGLNYVEPNVNLPQEVYREKFEKIASPLREIPELTEFAVEYTSVLKICQRELENLDGLINQFCTSYLEALQPTSPNLNSTSFQPVSANISPVTSSPKVKDDKSMKRDNGTHTRLPKESVLFLKRWLFDNSAHPYPSEEEKRYLIKETGMTLTQLNNWFINARRRILKPMQMTKHESESSNNNNNNNNNTKNQKEESN